MSPENEQKITDVKNKAADLVQIITDVADGHYRDLALMAIETGVSWVTKCLLKGE